MTTALPTPPDTDAAAFVAALRRLKAWSGLSYRRLERHAADVGHCLPYSTAATMLGKDRLPREELVAAFVAACGVRGDEAEAWLDARTGIACGPAPADATPTLATPTDAIPTDATPANIAPAVAAPARTRPWRTRWTLFGAAALVTALLGGAAASGIFTDDEEVLETSTSARL
ncbi:hypothetical protein GCM10023084_82030 [Streptomyces lacrimifluminis]|uniref:Helix-turn-helix domain-containing protein n=1 Tax=Streptomyces lacrimifluminis TaxID=1500077 RepID=A0A917PB78_9ACTN|nr:hypothetical protein [Streptomyces lacrimifluminis]GGJ69317.1 hypothetical protein GCM10012282_77850 [Streptomyces lacrimifluminis]